MINSINITDVRRMCDKAGFKYDETESGNIMLLFNDDDYPHTVGIFFNVDDNKWLTMTAMSGIEISRNQLADALYRVNKINREYRFMKAFIDSEGYVMLTRQELIDEYVSEEWVYENFIKLMPLYVMQALKEYFSDF